MDSMFAKTYEGRHAYMSDKAGVTPTQAGQQSKLNSVEGRVLGSSNTLSKIASQPSPSSKAPKDLT